jgi:predicted transcriptional regulator
MHTETDDEPLTEDELRAVKKSLEEYEKGIYFTHEEILADLGIKKS